MVTVGGTIITIDGNRDPAATIEFTLCGYGSQNPHAVGTGQSVGTLTGVKAEADVAEGTAIFTIQLIGNDLIYPPGTYYTATTRDSNGDVLQCNAYRFEDGQTYDLDYLPPIDPNLPPYPIPPPLSDQIIIVPSGPAPVFDGSVFTAWQFVLTEDATAATVTGCVPGNLYTFLILQDATGGHKFTWPSNVGNATLIDPAPSSRTIQTFIADANGNLVAVAPGTYWL